MKKLILAVAVLFAVSVQAEAQGRKGGQGKGVGRQNEKMGAGHQRGGERNQKFADLNLSEAQKEKMKTLQQSFQSDMKALQQNEQITVKEQRDRKQALIQNHRKAIQEILTPEQKKQMEDKKQARKQEMQAQRSTRLNETMKTLNLNATQIESVKANQDAFHAKMESIRSNESLSREDRKAAIQQATQNMQHGLKAILTPDQFNKWKAMKASKPGNRPERGGKAGRALDRSL